MMAQLSKQPNHVRPASKALGDDVTFARYVRTNRKHTGIGKPKSLKLPGLEHPAMVEGRSYFTKSVRSPDILKNLLVSGHSNVKIGRDCRVGKLKGHWIYTLSLEERATCPRACHHWQTCYGNGMPYAKRIDHRADSFRPRLKAEIDVLMKQAKRRNGCGIIIRLHALGDFYSQDYVTFWAARLLEHPKLVLFGYTAWLPGTEVGDAVEELIDMFPGRAMIRFSNGGMANRSTIPIVDVAARPPGAFVCPDQTGQFEGCGRCGACWSTLKNVAFLDH